MGSRAKRPIINLLGAAAYTPKHISAQEQNHAARFLASENISEEAGTSGQTNEILWAHLSSSYAPAISARRDPKTCREEILTRPRVEESLERSGSQTAFCCVHKPSNHGAKVALFAE